MLKMVLLSLVILLLSFSPVASQTDEIEANYAYPHYQVRSEAKHERLYVPQQVEESYIVRFECFDSSLNTYFEVLMTAEDRFEVNMVLGWDMASQWLSTQDDLVRGQTVLAGLDRQQVGEFYLTLYCPEERYTVDETGVIHLDELQVLVIAVPDETLRLQVQVPEKAPSLVTWSPTEGWNIYGYLGGLTIFAADASYIFVGLPSPQTWADSDQQTIESWFRSYDVITFANNEGELRYVLIQWEGN